MTRKYYILALLEFVASQSAMDLWFDLKVYQCCRLFNAEAILVEEQQWYYLNST